MMTPKPSKLTLSRETVRVLNDDEVNNINGGTSVGPALNIAKNVAWYGGKYAWKGLKWAGVNLGPQIAFQTYFGNGNGGNEAPKPHGK